MIQIENASIEFESSNKSNEIFKDFSLTIAPHEIVCILGSSGCGKSTLLRSICGLHPLKQGQIRGLAISQNTSAGEHALLSVVFQEPALLPWRTALENVLLPLELGTQDKTSRSLQSLNKDRALSMLELVGLKEDFNKYPHELSGGMKMRTSLARALLPNPDWIFMDEPFSALDEITREKLQVDLYEIHQKLKNSIVFVTHSLPEATFLAARVIILKGRPAQIQWDDRIQLPQDRGESLRNSTEYFNELKRIKSIFKEAVQ